MGLRKQRYLPSRYDDKIKEVQLKHTKISVDKRETHLKNTRKHSETIKQ